MDSNSARMAGFWRHKLSVMGLTRSAQPLSQDERQHLGEVMTQRNLSMATRLGWVTLPVSVLLASIDVERWRLGKLDGSPLYLSLLILHLGILVSGLLSLVLAIPAVRDIPSRSVPVLRTLIALCCGSLLAMGVLAVPERGSLTMLALGLCALNLVFPHIPLSIRASASLATFAGASIALAIATEGSAVLLLPRVGEALAITLLALVLGASLSTGRLQQILAEFREARRTAELQLSESRLRMSQQQLQRMFDSMQDGFVRFGLDGRIEAANPMLLKMLGWDDLTALQAANARALFASEDERKRLARAFAENGVVRDFRCTVRAKDGNTLDVEVNGQQARDASGELLGFEGVVRDVSRQVEVERNLKRARNEAQAAAESRAAFLANMSHEIRTPMNAIIGLTQLALRTELTPKQQDYLGKAHVAANNLLGILNDILDLSKIESGKLSLEQTEFELDEVLDSVITLLRMPIEEKGLKLKVWRAPEVPDRLIGDPLRLGQVLTNLVGNARKFTERGGIEVRVTRTDAAEASQGSNLGLRVTVRDTGIGMTPEQCKRLFQPFSQADESTTRRYGGTGLGLAISRQLVEMMGGWIDVDSEPGVGSTFTFELNLQAANPDAPVRGRAGDRGGSPGQDPIATSRPTPDEMVLDEAALATLRGARVLLVEDNPINQQVASEFLQQAGLRVEVAADGQLALDALAERPYDIVLMDVQMPVMDGYTATQRIRQNPAWSALPVIAMTANVMTEDRARVLAVGMNGHVAKPISQRELFETLLKWIPPLRSSSPEELATSGSAIPSSEVKLPAELPGFDLPRALVNLGGNRRLLRKLLADLHGAHHSDVVAIHDALREDRWKDAERLAHTLKTVAGTLAAAELQRSASALEMVLRRGEHGQAEEILTRLRSVMEPLMAGLARWLHQEESASAAATPVDDANAGDPLVSSRRAQAQRLLQLLEELDPQAHEEALELAKGLPAEHPAHAVASAAAGYDFDTARTLLEKLIAPKP